MCLSPVTIINPNKYISLRYRDSFLLQVPCGHCAECQSVNSAQWQYRTYFQYIDAMENSQYLYFDTLTYNSENLPTTDKLLNTSVSFPCFSHDDITLFFKRLRDRIKRRYKVSGLKYFLSSEYGEKHKRPHYHVLLFVDSFISPVDLSSMVAESWQMGRTDGVPYKSRYYVENHNVIRENVDGNYLRAINYVTKYVQKNCSFQDNLNSRISLIAKDIFFHDNPFASDEDYYSYTETVDYSIQLTAIKRVVNQFHRQSLHYGELALRDFDLNDLVVSGCVRMPAKDMIIKSIPLPMYYKRKLFYTLIECDGVKVWQKNDFGLEYDVMRYPYLLKSIKDRYESIKIQYKMSYDSQKLAEYVLKTRGRIVAENPSNTLMEKLPSVTLFNYSHRYDKKALGELGLSSRFLGNSKLGYSAYHTSLLKFGWFIKNYVLIDEVLEKHLTEIAHCRKNYDDGKQNAFRERQRLSDLHKQLFRKEFFLC